MRNFSAIATSWYFYVDESGARDPNENDTCFCFAILAIPGAKKGFTESEKEQKIKKGIRANIDDLIKTREIICSHDGFVNMTYIDFSKKGIAQAMVADYRDKIRNSNLSSRNIPTLAEFNSGDTILNY